MFNLFLSVVKLNYIFSKLTIFYSKPVFINFVTPAISFFAIGLKGIVGYSGKLYSFFIIGIVWFLPNPENPISMSFLGFKDLW